MAERVGRAAVTTRVLQPRPPSAGPVPPPPIGSHGGGAAPFVKYVALVRKFGPWSVRK